jgi:DNA-binding FrmR family transcriptional regulator
MPREGSTVGIKTNAADTEIIQRLRSANGHLQGVIAMVEAGESCESVLHQLGAVQAAIRCAARALIQCQLDRTADSLLSDPCPETRAQTVLRLSNLYILLIKT